MDTLISNVTAVTMNERMQVLFGAFLGITDGKISYLDTVPPKDAPAAIIEGTGMVVIPGLINCHTHLASTALRSLTDDLSNRESLEALLKKEAKMDSRSAKAAALLGIAECLRFGVTSVSDLYYYPGATAEAAAEAGIKANLSLSAYRFEDEFQEYDFLADPQIVALTEVVEKWNGYDEDRIRIDAGIHAEYTGNHLLWEGMAAFAAENKIGIQLHLSETLGENESCLDRSGLSPAELLSCHGIFDVPACAAGCNCLSHEDRTLLARKKVSAIALPMANAKCGLPSADISACVKAGMNVALGTDGIPTAGNLDMFPVMRSAVCAARENAGDASAMPASAALMMATVCGASAQGRAATCGMLKVGMDADLALLNFTSPHLMPCHNVLTGLVFSAQGSDVAMTMVRGKILYQNGRYPTIDLSSVIQELTQYAIPHLFSDDNP